MNIGEKEFDKVDEKSFENIFPGGIMIGLIWHEKDSFTVKINLLAGSRGSAWEPAEQNNQLCRKNDRNVRHKPLFFHFSQLYYQMDDSVNSYWRKIHPPPFFFTSLTETPKGDKHYETSFRCLIGQRCLPIPQFPPYPLRRLSIPQIGHAGGSGFFDALFAGPQDVFFPGAGQHIGSDLYSNGPLRVFPDCYAAWHAQGRCFFLKPAAVCQHHPGVLPQIQGFREGKGRQQKDVFREMDAHFVDVFPGSGMHRKEYRPGFGNVVQRRDDFVEYGRIIHVGGSVEGQKGILPVLLFKIVSGKRLFVAVGQFTGLMQ